MAYEALHSLQETLNRILKQHHHSDINQEIISIHDEVVALLLHLKNNPENLGERERIKEAANTTEEIIEFLLSEDNPLYGGRMKPTVEHLMQLRKAAQNFRSTAGDAVVHSVNSKRRLTDISPSVGSTSRAATTSKDVVVGFDEDIEKIKYRLIISYQPCQLQVLSIVGTGGTGKTTLAKLVYNDKLTVNSFKIRAWVTVSHSYSVENILLNLLASLERDNPIERDGQREVPMESLIRTYLKDRRFLIIIDDLCSEKSWDDLKVLFSDINSRSWIILTTRLHDVATYVDSSSPVHAMRLLDAHHSWNLLQRKVFVDGSCPIELEDVGRNILRNYGGLPLSIVVVAGILSKLPKTRNSWKQIAANDGNLETIICLSYNQLPDYMRACFLYMGGFPEDYEIPASELIQLWIAEGFLKCPKILEEEAAKVLADLVERSLILVSRRKFDGKVKSCCLHDILRDFCIRQAEREKFLLSVTDYLPTPILRRHFLPRLLKNHHRISATSHDLHLKDSTHSSFTHSIICIPQRGYKCVSSMHKFSSLKLFHVLRAYNYWEWEPSQVFDLIYLTYLASNIPTIIVPPIISKLQNLETLIIYRSEVVLPVEIWLLRRLRHLRAFSFNSLPRPDGATLPLENLETISLVMDFVCCGRMVEIFPNIKKLGICFNFDVGYDNLIQLSRLESLNNLEHLPRLEKLKLEGRDRFSDGELQKKLKLLGLRALSFLDYTVEPFLRFVFPLSLKKLTLCGLGLPWADMRIIGLLPKLQVLKLRNNAGCGYYRNTIEGEFVELRVLLIENSYLTDWTTCGRSFQKLECLILIDCPRLRAIPSEIRNIPTLELIGNVRPNLKRL